MNRPLRIIGFALCLVESQMCFADDTELFTAQTRLRPMPHVHLVIDVADNLFAPICQYGSTASCGSLVAGSTVVNLDDSHQPGDPVSRFDALTLALSTVLSEKRFDQMALALVVSPQPGDYRQVSPYITLADKMVGLDGSDRLIQLIETLDGYASWSALEGFSSYRELAESLAAQRSDESSGTLAASCSVSYSVFVSVGTVTTQHPSESNSWRVTAHSADSGQMALPQIVYQKLQRALTQIQVTNDTKVVDQVTPNVVVSAVDIQQLYVAMFAPQPLQRWPGNVKKFALAPPDTLAAEQLDSIIDARGLAAIDSAGNIASAAIGLWTSQAALAAPDKQGVIDGPRVTRGGVGQRIPGYIAGSDIGDSNADSLARQVFTESQKGANGERSALLAFDANGTSSGSLAARLQDLLGASSAAQAQTLVRWARGQDVDDEDGDGDIRDARPWLLGGVIHSKPLVLNYGAIGGYTRQAPRVRLFFGSVDGIFHGIENTRRGGGQLGTEVFAFYPRSVLADIAAQRDNIMPAANMSYGVDGSASALVADNNGDGNIDSTEPERDEAYLYFGQRRGGHHYYALDVSDTNAAPALLWKIGRTDNGSFDELGLTFSKPLVGKVKFDKNALDVVIFAGGYHGGWNSDYTAKVGKDESAADDVDAAGSYGNALFIVNARTGELIWKAVFGDATDSAATGTNTRFRHRMLVDSIPSTVSALRHPNGLIHRLYFGDTGGAVWRVDLPVAGDSAGPDHRKQHWFISKLAELGSDGVTTDRRFFHAPDIIRAQEDNGDAFDGVLISSGNRADPGNLEVVNYHFYLKDHVISSGDDAARTRLPIQLAASAAQRNTINKGIPRLADSAACTSPLAQGPAVFCDSSPKHGWMLKMIKPGEKSFASPLVDGGKVFFTSYVPPAQHACSIEQGASYVYLVNLSDASEVSSAGHIFPLGKGVAPGIQTAGDGLISPLGGLGEIPQGVGCEGKLCERHAKPLQTIYWRETGVDEI